MGALFAGGLRRLRLPAVRLCVPRQRRLPRERPATLRAQVLAAVRAAVRLQLRRRREEPSADGAAVAAGCRVVHELVPLQRLLDGEAATALSADEGPLARVHAPVRSEVGPKPEALLTVRTAEACFFVPVLPLSVDLGVVPRDPQLLRWVRGALHAGESS